MNHCDLSQAEQKKRREIAEHTRKMILSDLKSKVRMTYP